jgi:hypothetical protein
LLERIEVKPIILELVVPSIDKPPLTQSAIQHSVKRNRKSRNNDFFMEHLNANSVDSSDTMTEICRKNNKSLSIFHQNICGLKGKINEIISTLHPRSPHLLCLSEHHLEYSDLCHTHIEHYNLGAEYCRKSIKQGGVCIFIHDSINYVCMCKGWAYSALAL